MPDAAAVGNAVSAFRPARRPALLVALLALLVVAIPGSAVAAAPSSDWTRQTTAHSPSVRSGASMAFDQATGKIVLFGGGDFRDHFSDTWTYDGTDWTQQTTAHSPPARRFASMAFDPATGKVVLFDGGGDLSTWTYDGTDWTQQTTAHSPRTRESATMAFDPATGKIVLFGGSNGGGILANTLNDTWTYDGADWTQQSPTHSPPARGSASMAFDPATGKIVLFASDLNRGTLPDTWTYDGTDWTQQSPTHSPPARGSASMAFDPATGKIVLFGGTDDSGDRNDTWTYEGSDWAQQSPAHSPPVRDGASMAFDAATGKLVLFGGFGDNGGSGSAGAYLSDTWTYVINPEPETTITHTPKNPKPSHTHFSFRSSIAGSTFVCMLDDANPEPCTSPQDYRDLEPGHHVFSVVATSPKGQSDPAPATARFRVTKPSR
jgi:hypothetical protein